MVTNEMLKALKKRRSCRNYRPKQIIGEELNVILEAGTYAPTARGRQSLITVAVQNPAMVEQLRKVSAAVLGTPEAGPFYNASAVLVMLVTKDNTNRIYDDNYVMSNLMDATRAVGLVSCQVHRAKEVSDSEEDKALLRQWGVEGDYEDIDRYILGYRVDTAPTPALRRERYVYRVRQGGKQVPRPGRGIRYLQRRDRAYTR